MSQMIQSNISDSPELRLLRQENLQLYAEINTRAFSGANLSEIPKAAYLRTIEEAKADVVEGDYSKPAQLYMDLMLGKYHSYDRRKGEPWIGTEMRGDTEMVVLLEPGARALRVLRDLETDQSFLAVSSLSSLTDRITAVVARMSGDVTQQIAALEARRTEIDADIAALKARGAIPMSKRERQTEIYAALHDISQIRAGFSEVPGARRRINRDNQDIFLESDESQGDVLDIFFDRTRSWEESGEAAILSTLRDMHVDIQKGQNLQAQLEAMVEQCADLLDARHRRDIVSFLPDMLEISSDITIEISNIWKAVHAYISNPNYTAKRADARALRDAHDAAIRIRNEVKPSPRDTRLKEVGLLMTEPLRTAPQTDLRLTFEAPEREKEEKTLPASIHQVTIVENIETFFGYAPRPGVCLFFGSGNAIAGMARSLPFLSDKRVVYWGDIDSFGMKILSRLRRVVPHAVSALMDRETVTGVARDAWRPEPESDRYKGGIDGLTPDEQGALTLIRAGHHRIEQEHLRPGPGDLDAMGLRRAS